MLGLAVSLGSRANVAQHRRTKAQRRFATIRGMNSEQWINHLTMLAYRVAGYATTNLIDDPAMLALIFC
jgi:hypothetical protein